MTGNNVNNTTIAIFTIHYIKQSRQLKIILIITNAFELQKNGENLLFVVD